MKIFARIGILAACVLSAASAEAAEARRWAVVVGSNAAVLGRAALRYAHSDAKAVATVLQELGEFQEQDIRLLLDPRPEEVVATLDAILSKASGFEDALLLFYYSGHADEHALYPDGAPLPLDELRKRLADPRARVRLGIVDACRGGGWTGAKGLTKGSPFEIETPTAPESQGTVLIASSSGDQSAHEAEALRGSFFTHHLVAAMRGAADEDTDGAVALIEAFSYARRRTIRDAAFFAHGDQNPSFQVDMTGRRDVVLTRIDRAESRMVLEAHPHSLEIVHLDSGAVVAEMPASEQAQTLAMSPGAYLVRGQREDGNVVGAEIALKARETVSLAASRFRVMEQGKLAEKSMPESVVVRTDVRLSDVVTDTKMVKISLLPDAELGSTFFLKTTYMEGSYRHHRKTTALFDRLCTAPCEVTLPAGEHAFGVMKANGDEIVATDILRIEENQKLRAVWDDGSEMRNAGLGLGAVGATVAALFIGAGAMQDDGELFIGLGAATAGASLVTMLGFFIAGTDRVHLEVE